MHSFLDGIFDRRIVQYPGVIQMMKMKNNLTQALVMGIGIPALLVSWVFWRGSPNDRTNDTKVTVPTNASTIQQNRKITIQIQQGEQVIPMELEDYLFGVLLAEMPATFEMDALKAQAIAARTFTLYCQQQKVHEGVAVCTSASCCQGYISPLRYLEQGGSNANVEKVRLAVTETAGQVLTYRDQLILATYFDCSGGMTEDAMAVWGEEYPYLKPVESPGEEDAAYFTDKKTFSKQEVEGALGISLTGVPGAWFGVITYTPGGGVKTIDICGETFQGTDVRKRLGLRSTAFTLSVSENAITIYTRGYGHRVGLSQYGADAMALSGQSYEQILSHYYPGTKLVQIGLI